MLRLIVQNDQGRRAELPLELPEVTIGRGDENTVQLDDRNVSRRHARLRQSQDSYVLEDLGSSNGIWMNGKRLIGNVFVKGGDSFRLGDYEVVVEEDSAGRIAPHQPTVGNGDYEQAIEVHDSDLFPADFHESSSRTEEIHPQGLTPEQGVRWVDLPNPSARLILTNTIESGREFPLVRAKIEIGRAEDNEIQIQDPSVSSHHARLERLKSERWRICEVDASGLSINGVRKSVARLENGDEIRLGRITLTFLGSEQTGPLLQLGEVMSRRGQRLRAVLFLALVASFAGIGGGFLVLFWLKNQMGSGQTSVPPVAKEEITRGAVPKEESAEFRADRNRPEESVSRTPRSESAPTQNAPIARYEPKLYAAKAAMARKDFRRVVDILEPVQHADGSRPPDAEELIQQATTELRAKRSLSLAQKNLQSGRLEDAGRYLEEASDTKAYVKEYRQLKARADSLTAQRQAKRSRSKDSLEGRPSAPSRVALAKQVAPPKPEDPPVATEESVPSVDVKASEVNTTSPDPTPPPAAVESPPVVAPPPPVAPPLTAAELAAIAELEHKPPPRDQRAVSADPGAWIVVGHPSLRQSVSRGDLRQIFSGDSVPSEGGRFMQIVLGPVGDPARRRFLSEGVGRSEAQFKAAWTRLLFRGGGVRPPLEMNDDESVVAAVASRPGAIGVVHEGTPLSGVIRISVR